MTLSREIDRSSAVGANGSGSTARAKRFPGPTRKARRSRRAFVYLTKVVIATVIEANGIFWWLWLYAHGDPWWGLLVLVIGESAETLLFRTGTTRDTRERWGSLDATSPGITHFRTVQRRVLATGIAEVLIWVLWLYVAEDVGWGAAAGALLVLMHLKHHVEVATIRDRRFRSGLFSVHGTFASALEVAGGVVCLHLIDDDRFLLAGVALGVAILLEHAIQIEVLNWEMKARDIRLPRDKRWKHPPRRRPVLFYLFTHFAWVWRRVQRVRRLELWANRFAINGFIGVVEPRPNPLSTMADYTSWPSLIDCTYSGRHLPPVPRGAPCPATSSYGSPSAREAASLFGRGEDMIACPKSTLVFAFFAQWFTDGFLRSARNLKPGVLRDTQRNESTHEIDLCQLYGLTHAATRQLRAGPDDVDGVTGRPRRGLLKNQMIDGEEYPAFYCQRRNAETRVRSASAPGRICGHRRADQGPAVRDRQRRNQRRRPGMQRALPARAQPDRPLPWRPEPALG